MINKMSDVDLKPDICWNTRVQKLSWPILRYYPVIGLDGLRKIKNHLNMKSQVWHSGPGVPLVFLHSRSANHYSGELARHRTGLNDRHTRRAAFIEFLFPASCNYPPPSARIKIADKIAFYVISPSQSTYCAVSERQLSNSKALSSAHCFEITLGIAPYNVGERTRRGGGARFTVLRSIIFRQNGIAEWQIFV
jgi:hypothetical protein